MEFDVLEKEYVAERTGSAYWEIGHSERENEIRKKQNELDVLRQRLGEWESRFSSRVSMVILNGIVIKRILKN